MELAKKKRNLKRTPKKMVKMMLMKKGESNSFQRHQSKGLMLEKSPGKSKKVDIIVLIRRALQLIINKALTGGINHVFQVGQLFKLLSHIKRYFPYLWTLSSQYKLLLKANFPISFWVRLDNEQK